MTHPISLTRPLLVQLLAAVVLCPVAFARPKSKPEPVKPAATVAAKLPPTAPAKSGKPAIAKQTKGQPAAQTSPAPQPRTATPVKTGSAKVAPAKPDTSRLTKAQKAKAQEEEARRAKAQQAALSKKNPPSRPQQQKLAVVPQKPQTQGDGPPPDQRYDHRALIIPVDELRARVPTQGMLNEEDCILMAIATSPELQKRRSQIKDRIAARQADKDWENPELRLSYASQSDDFLRNPFVERSIENYSATEDRIGDQTTTGIGGIGVGEVIADTETGTTTTTRYREIERLVTPGRFGDTVTTNVYEVRKDASTGIRDRTIDLNGSVQSRRDSLEENVERTLRSTATETMASSAENGNQESFSALLRVRMPHPWVKKAKLARAAAEITLAEAQYLADEDKLVREIRALFQELSVKQSTLKAHQNRRQNLVTFRTEMEGLPTADYAVDAARASIDLADILRDYNKINSDTNNLRSAIAVLCGISNPARIYSPGIVTRRILDYRDLSQSYLVEMAMLYRADAVESRGRLGIAKALLEEAKAAKIPWATFIDASYSRQGRDGYSGDEDEWMIRVGIEIPFFDWTGINKRGREYRAAAVEWEKQFNMQRERIEMEVAVALHRVKGAYKDLREFDTSVKTEQGAIKDRLAKLEIIDIDPGLIKNPRVRYAAEDATQLLEIGRYGAYANYNEAMTNLEDTIGIRIEKVLSRAAK